MFFTNLSSYRSDIFPFLDRVTYLCLGDVVYTGATRMMLDYFRSIGFPCPELENPLMYYCKKLALDNWTMSRQIHFFSVPVHRGPAIEGAVHRVEQPDRVPRREVQAGGRRLQEAGMEFNAVVTEV